MVGLKTTEDADKCREAMRYGHIMQWAFGCSQYLTQLQTCSPCSKMRSGFSLNVACKYAKEIDRDRVKNKASERERKKEKETEKRREKERN